VQASGLQVIGVSYDTPDLHVSFINQLNLNFPLASDADGKLCASSGTCPIFPPGGEQDVIRTAFVIESDGRISGVFNANGGPDLIDMIWDTAQALGGPATPSIVATP
jgi:peroxiredoxin